MSSEQPLLKVDELTTHFYTFEGIVRAVDNVSFSLCKGDVIGIVGESGCGKSVTAQSIMRLIPEPPGKIVQGSIYFHNLDILKLPRSHIRSIRGSKIAMVFQEPMTSLNPVYTIGEQISEMFMLHKKTSKQESWKNVIKILDKVQIPSPEKRAKEYPHQLSGGMRQRVMIAMALSCNPEILIADEPTTALDVTVQAQILDLMRQLREDFGTAIILITHDLGVINEFVERVIVMYAGKIVEEANTEEIFKNPKHPYTQALLDSIPKHGDRSLSGRRRLSEINGVVPNLINPPKGCRFSPRCSRVLDICTEKMPILSVNENNHSVYCWQYAKDEVEKTCQ